MPPDKTYVGPPNLQPSREVPPKEAKRVITGVTKDTPPPQSPEPWYESRMPTEAQLGLHKKGVDWSLTPRVFYGL